VVGDGGKIIACPGCSAAVPAGVGACPNCGAAIEDVSRTLTSGFTAVLADESWERFAPGSTFANRYTIIEEIGHGGMGRVFKAIDRSLGITVAIKIIRPEYASNPRVVELFKRETVLARSISSENVVRVHDLGEAEKTKYISMDFVEGQNLRDLIYASGSLTISTAVKFGQQTCRALSAAHREGIIHRDLKPSNIMIDKTGRVRVMDFGLAKTINREDEGGTRALVGTPEYLSPEQARGEKLDQRTDIYALGLVLYEMLTGRPVFEADSLTGYIQKHCEANPEPPSRWNHLIPAALETIILKCLKKDRNDRYQKAEDVCQALDRIIAPEAKPFKATRSRLLRYSAGAAACVLLGFIAYRVFVHPKPTGPSVRKSVAVMSFENLTRDPSQDRWRNLLRHLISTDLELSKFLRVVSREKLLQYLKDLNSDDSGGYTQEALDRIADKEQVDFFLLGGFLASGDECRIDLRLVDAGTHDNAGTGSFNVASFEEIQDRCDDISRWTKEKLGLTKRDLAKDFDRELKDYTTASVDAVVSFSRGLDFYEKGDYEQSKAFYLKAIDFDDRFALAYARLAENCSYLGQTSESAKYLQKAMSLRKNLSPREKWLIEGDYHNILENDFPRAIEAYQNLLSLYPDDKLALAHVGAVYRNIEEWDKAEECFERLRSLDPQSSLAVQNLCFIFEALGQYERAAGVLVENRGLFEAPEDFQVGLAFCLFCQGLADRALEELGKAISLNPDRFDILRLLGQIQVARGDYVQAEAAYRRLKDDDRSDPEKLEGCYWLGQLYLLQGKYQNCSREINAGLQLARSRDLGWGEPTLLVFESYLCRLRGDFRGAQETAARARKKAKELGYRGNEIEALHQMGLSEIGLGWLPEAQRTVETMAQIIKKMGFPRLLRYCHHLEGMIALSRESWDAAVKSFGKAAETLPQQHLEYDQHAHFLESLAQALLQSGDADAARERYEQVISLTTGFLTAGDAWARSLYQLARLAQSENNPEPAKAYFRRLLNALQDADPGLPEAEDARKRLAAIS
jgi:serine/threonine protein kinase/Flp pilus assembly protein TadD